MFYKERLFPKITERYLDKHGDSFPMSSKSVDENLPCLILNKIFFTVECPGGGGGACFSKLGDVRLVALGYKSKILISLRDSW